MKIEELDYQGLKITIHTDEDPASPREWDNLGTMVCFHPRYNLGDEMRRGDYGPSIDDDVNVEKWANQLESIQRKIQKSGVCL